MLEEIRKMFKDYIYYESKNGILLNGDSLELLKLFPEDYVDLILTDPPYNIADNNKLTKVGNKIKTNKEAWGDKFKDSWKSVEDYFIWFINIIGLFKKNLKESGSLITFLDRKYTGYAIYLIEKQVKLKFRNKIYFEKNNPLPRFRKNNYRSCIEEGIWFTKNFGKNYCINFISQKEMKQIFRGNIGRKETIHPTEKYEWMINPIIKRHSNKNDIVLDTFMGSGTTAVACERLGRKWIGIEIEEKYCEITKKRLKPFENVLF